MDKMLAINETSCKKIEVDFKTFLNVAKDMDDWQVRQFGKADRAATLAYLSAVWRPPVELSYNPQAKEGEEKNERD